MFKGNVVQTLNQEPRKNPVVVQHTQRDHHSLFRQMFHLSGSAFGSDPLAGDGRIPAEINSEKQNLNILLNTTERCPNISSSSSSISFIDRVSDSSSLIRS